MTYNIPFMRYHRLFVAVAVLAMALSAICVVFRGFNTGIDFTGGNLIQLEFPEPVDVGEVRGAMATIGYGQATIQAYSDRGIIIRVMQHQGTTPQELQEAVIQAADSLHRGSVRLLGFEMVGPTVGGELRNQAVLASAVSLIGILIYVTFRFRFRFAVVSVLALVHDTLVVLGLFSLLQEEIGMTFIAAILTTIGYSLNNTIVIFDRVRENWKLVPKLGLLEVLDSSINSTLARTINTSVTTFLPVLAFYLWGGEVLSGFSLAIMAGIIFGGYSSVCVTSSLLFMWYEKAPEK